MTDEKLGVLFEAFANFYWSVPVEFIIDKITDWHPEITAQQIERVLYKCNSNVFWHHCCVVSDGIDGVEGLKEPELVTEHLIALSLDNLNRFLATRVEAPLYDCSEEILLTNTTNQPDIPEIKEIIDFGKTELGLDDEWTEQLVHDCIFNQPSALCEGKSWVMDVLEQEKYGKIRFRNIEQVERFRTLGNSLYQVMPNPVLRGWKPADIDNPPALLDDIPEKDSEIPDGRKAMDEICAPYGGREKVSRMLMRSISESVPKKRKIGRNEPCPCGSGKKYKKCCGRWIDS